ncbi:MAG: DUF1122 family protein [Dehalococcoidia bacterium]
MTQEVWHPVEEEPQHPLAALEGKPLFQAGFRGGFKDWYTSEGGSEGPRKLQAFQALDADHATAKARELALEAQQFLARPASKDSLELTSAAAERARALLEGPLGG